VSFSSLPNAYLQWDESAEPLATFIRYNVYRRRAAAAWTRIAAIPDRSITYYNDFAVKSGLAYEYTVTVTKDLSGQEVEGVKAAAVSVTVAFLSSFLHAWRAPAYYAELLVTPQSITPEQDIAFVQPWSARAPIGHVGPKRAKRLSLTAGDMYWDDGSAAEVWDALEAMQERQFTAGDVLLYRDARGTAITCQVRSMNRGDQPITASVQLELQEVQFTEEV